MHGSHKLWMWVAVFLVVLGLLAGMFFTATPEKMKPVMEKQKAAMQKKKEMQQKKNDSAQEQKETQAQAAPAPEKVSAK